MSAQEQPQPKVLIIDWQIHVLYDLTGAIFRFLVLPLQDEPSEAKPTAPLGMNLEEMRRLHSDLGEMISLMEKSPGTSGTPQ